MGRKKQLPPLQVDQNGVVRPVPAEPEPGAPMVWATLETKHLADTLNQLEGEGGQIIQILPETATSYPTIVYRKPA
jgi:hypothetical protein